MAEVFKFCLRSNVQICKINTAEDQKVLCSILIKILYSREGGIKMREDNEQFTGNESLEDKRSQDKLRTAPISKLIVSLAVPAIIAQVINALYNIVDRIYISRIPQIGDMAIAGVGVCFPILILISAFAQLIGVGGSTLAAIELGKRNQKRAEEMLGNGFVCLIMLSVVLTIVFQFTKHPILMAFGASQSTVGYGLEYLSIYLFGTIFVETTLGLNQFITCQGKSKIAMLTIFVGAGLNIVLDPVFIFVLDMGVKGAAVATVISQAASSIWIIHFLLSKNSNIKIRKEFFPLRKDIVLSITALGVSSFIMSFTECLINVVFNSGLQKYGGDYYVAAMTIIQSIMQIVYIFSNGITQGVQPVISFNYGARQIKRVKSAYRIGFASHITVAVLSSGIIILFPRFFASLFTENQTIIGIIIKMMPVFLCGWGIFGIQSGAQCAFVGLGQAKISLFLACLRKVFLLTSLAIVLPHFIGVNGIFLAEPISDITSAVIAGVLFAVNINKILNPVREQIHMV